MHSVLVYSTIDTRSPDQKPKHKEHLNNVFNVFDLDKNILSFSNIEPYIKIMHIPIDANIVTNLKSLVLYQLALLDRVEFLLCHQSHQ